MVGFAPVAAFARGLSGTFLSFAGKFVCGMGEKKSRKSQISKKSTSEIWDLRDFFPYGMGVSLPSPFKAPLHYDTFRQLQLMECGCLC